ncbi:hypothetical protein [Oceanibium sediminis]|uniref:hypothetical protein n=1 Tax=Oceanibium sediminis TaxID=2026339 RepID=UPI000DD3E9C8|nr:hypothetical protein [Oceanibium sediminis]
MFRSRKRVATEPHIPTGIKRRQLRYQPPPVKPRRPKLRYRLAVPLRYGAFLGVLWLAYNVLSPADRLEIAEFLTEKTGVDFVEWVTPAPKDAAEQSASADGAAVSGTDTR